MPIDVFDQAVEKAVLWPCLDVSEAFDEFLVHFLPGVVLRITVEVEVDGAGCERLLA